MGQRYEEKLYTVEEYLAREEKSLEKHEYYRGRIYHIFSGTPEHALITANAIATIGVAIRPKGYLLYSSSLLIRVETRSHYTYADITVVCGPPQFEQIKHHQLLTNPALIVEVLSPTTHNYDRGTKFQLYKALASFQDYLLIDSRQMYVQHYRKQDENTWQEKTYTHPEQVINLENLAISLSLTDIYRHVEFEPEPEFPA